MKSGIILDWMKKSSGNLASDHSAIWPSTLKTG